MFDKDNRNSGLSLLELIIVIAIMGVLVGALTPMFLKYVEKSKKSKDIYTADQIARAVNVAFVENPEAYAAFQNWKPNSSNVKRQVSVMEFGVERSYWVYLVAASGQQSASNTRSNCFNGNLAEFRKKPDGTTGDNKGNDGFFGVVNRELGLSTTEMNSEIIPKYNGKRTGTGVDRGGGNMEPFAEVDRWRIVKRADNGMMEIWVAQPNPWGGYPIYRLWPEPDDEYRQ